MVFMIMVPGAKQNSDDELTAMAMLTDGGAVSSTQMYCALRVTCKPLEGLLYADIVSYSPRC